MWREKEARVASNIPLRHMNVDVPKTDAQPTADRVAGTALEPVGKNKRLVVLGLEVDGRFSREAFALLRPGRTTCIHTCGRVAAQRALACSLLELPVAGADDCHGTAWHGAAVWAT